ncbi:MAG: hypothetical protein LBV43_01425 [Prevotella sp.]|jgi:tetratricopeptide (TPR) repeat protein|nr:hypothetical protein [Prevotella sp.]
MKKAVIILIFFLLIFGSCDFRSSSYYNAEAEKLEAEGKYTEAVVFLDKAIEKNPVNIYALINRGVDKSLLEDYSGAIADYSRIIEIDGDNTLAYLNRGKNKKRVGDYKGAIKDFDEAIRTKGAEFLWSDKEENPLVDTGFEFDVPMEEIRFERGLARYKVDSLKTAFDDFTFCIQRNYELATSHYMVGIIHISYGKFDKACNALAKSKEYGDLDAQVMIDKYCRNK